MELKKAKKNIGSALFFLATSIFLYFIVIPWGVPQRASWGGDVGVDSRTFPYFAAVVMGITAVAFLAISCFEYKRAKQKESQQSEIEKVNMKEELRALTIYGLFILYAILFAKIGFILSTLIVPAIILFLLEERKILRYLSVYAVGGVLFIIFEILLKVQLP